MPCIRLGEDGPRWTAAAGAPLADTLFAHGVEFPCGGEGTCRCCRVRVRSGQARIHPEDAAAFDAAELAAGWRLACQLHADDDLDLAVGQWGALILGDNTLADMPPQDGCGIAIDLGSTTIAAQLVDRRDGQVLATRSALNPQARHGADLMRRIAYACAGGGDHLRDLVRTTLGELIAELAAIAPQPVLRTVVAGNTVMLHLLCGRDCARLAQHPFLPDNDGPEQRDGAAFGWPAAGTVIVLPGLGGFVGGDILAGLLACGLDRAGPPAALIDLGTNGEIAVRGPAGLVVASAAAGPAFEGASISCGMRAATGAVQRVDADDGRLRVTVIGGGPARGVCGSGLVAAVAAGRALHLVSGRGRAAAGLDLGDGVLLTQADIRELQLAKAAIAAGLQLCARAAGTSVDDLHEIHLAGAFGNALRCADAIAIGLLPGPLARIRSAGNSALRGARLLLNHDEPAGVSLRQRVRHHALREDPAFLDSYTDAMELP